jgi:hypothetical protein
MTHDELLTKVDSVFYEDEGGTQLDLAGFNNQYRALRAVVELHIPYGIDRYPGLQSYCLECEHLQSQVWPCPTIQAIEKELV